MAPADFLIRPAQSGEAATLTELCLRAKAYWGYDQAFMAAAAGPLRIREAQIGFGRVLTALEHGQKAAAACGVAAIVPLRRRGWIELSHLFVAPERFRLGIGRALFRAAIDLAAQQGARHLSILSDPNATGFYERLGARRCGESASGVVPGRMLPLLAFDIAQGRPEPRT
jgi:predicted N-acetyltransferase YhbS